MPTREKKKRIFKNEKEKNCQMKKRFLTLAKSLPILVVFPHFIFFSTQPDFVLHLQGNFYTHIVAW